jgi:hypothetical protein
MPGVRDYGNTIANLDGDPRKASHQFEYFAGLATELKGYTSPVSPSALRYTRREP